MKISEVGYHTEGIVKSYVNGLRRCATVAKLRDYLEDWKEIAPDAVLQARFLADAEWRFVLKHARSEKHGERVHELAGYILIPATLLKVTQLSKSHHVTEGLALIRLAQVSA